MDVVVMGPQTLRIKGRSSATIINPVASTGKTEADSVLFLGNDPELSDSKVEGSRIKIKGQGEYEVGGIKFSTIQVDEKLVARIDVDSVRILVGDGVSIEKIQDKVENCDLVIVNADNEFNYSVLTAIEPKVLLVYGAKKNEVSKSIGKTNGISTNKFSTTADKLPTEMQYVLLG